jgi:putative ABC transport system substrate-binding protein
MTRIVFVFVCLLLTVFLLSVFLAEAQQTKKAWRIGFMSAASPTLYSHLYAAFVQGLRDHGYIEGRNIVIEARWAEDRTDRLPELAAELVRRKVDLIAATGGAVTALAAKNATTTIPIVFIGGGDLVRIGLIGSLARPGGNLTGLSLLTTELSVKRLELLKETFPKVRRIAILGNPGNPAYAFQVRESQAAAKSLALQVEMIEAREPGGFESSFNNATEKGAGAVLLLSDPMFNAHRERIAGIAMKKRVPAISEFKEFTEAGGLMSYGTNIVDVYRRLATYVDKVFKGAKPGEIPVEQPTNFEFFINLKTAKQIGLTIPPNVLARADKVIR